MLRCPVLTKKLLKIKQNIELKKLRTFDLSYYIGKSYFEEDSTPNYLIFQPLNKYFKVGDGNALSWKSKGLSNESIKPPTTSDNSLTPI